MNSLKHQREMAVNTRLVLGLHIICLLLLLGVIIVNYDIQRRFTDTNHTMLSTLKLASELRQSSDDLTRFIRLFTVTGNVTYWECFNQIVAIRDGMAPLPVDPHRVYWDLYITGGPPRPSTPAVPLTERMSNSGFTDTELSLVTLAKSRSDALTDIESVAFHAMIGKYRPTDPNVIKSNITILSLNESLLFSVTAPPNQTYAMQLVHGMDYHRKKTGIMEPIDQFFVQSEQRAGNLQDISRESNILSGLEFGVIITLSGLVIYTSVEHWKSLSKCNNLHSGRIMAGKTAEAISGFRLSELEYLNELKDPDELQKAFITIVANLTLYKPYLPSHLISGTDGESESESEDGVTVSSEFLSESTPYSETGSAPVRCFSRLAVGLERRSSTIVAVGNPFTHSAAKYDLPTICNGYTQLSNWLSLSSNTRGNLSMSPTGVFFLTFRGKVECALALVHKCHKELCQTMNVTIGCCHGKDICGNVGGDNQRGYANLGQTMIVAETLSNLARKLRINTLVEEKTAESVPTVVALYRCKIQVYHKNSVNKLKAYNLLDILQENNEEWMYCFENRGNNPISELNVSLDKYFENGTQENLNKIPSVVTLLNNVVDLAWVRKVRPFPIFNCFTDRTVTLHPDQAEAVKSDRYRYGALVTDVVIDLPKIPKQLSKRSFNSMVSM